MMLNINTHQLSTESSLVICKGFIGFDRGNALYDVLKEYVLHALKFDTYAFSGKIVQSPRLIAFLSDTINRYSYSGNTHYALPIPTYLNDVIKDIELVAELPKSTFNGILVNYYRDGNDSISWHADNERSIKPKSTIASLSLGGSRYFKVRRKSNHDTWSFDIEHGDLVLMVGKFQVEFEHMIPKQPNRNDSRLNLTFRSFK